MASKPPKVYFSETEAARYLGVTLPDFRLLLQRHIIDREEDINNVSMTTFHASDLLLLRLVMSSQLSLAPPPQTGQPTELV